MLNYYSSTYLVLHFGISYLRNIVLCKEQVKDNGEVGQVGVQGERLLGHYLLVEMISETQPLHAGVDLKDKVNHTGLFVHCHTE